MECLGSILTKKYSKASPNAQFYGCNEVIDQIDNLCEGHAAVRDLLIHIEYSLKIHWARLRPLPRCERNLGYKYLGPDGARATSVGLR